ncbi:MAG: hypothetical protein K1X83_04310 [Oligoflexia bacterium]|nr:hypothetical protein [Oligoflexia bacterium]
MAFELSQDQRALADLLVKFCSTELTSEYIRKRFESDQITDQKLRTKLAELGIFELFDQFPPVASALMDLGIVAGCCGFSLMPESLIENLFAGPFLASCLLGEPERAKLADFVQLQELCRGSLLGTVGAAVVSKNADAELRLVPQAGQARYLLLLNDAGAQVVTLVDLKSPGVTLAPEQVLDRTLRRSRISLQGVRGLDLKCRSNPFRAFAFLKACESIGAARRAVEMTAAYVKERRQFDSPIGAFQAVQHRLADMYLKLEALQALSRFAGWAHGNSIEQFDLSAAALIAQTAEHTPWILESAIQLHGGIGFTWEYDLHLLLRRVQTNSALYGPPADNNEHLIELARNQ